MKLARHLGHRSRDPVVVMSRTSRRVAIKSKLELKNLEAEWTINAADSHAPAKNANCIR